MKCDVITSHWIDSTDPQTRYRQEAHLSLTKGQMLVHLLDTKCYEARDFHDVVSRAAVWWMTAFYWPDFPTFTYPSPVWLSMIGFPSSYRVHIWYGKTRMAGLQSGEGCKMIDSVIWAKYINMTDTRTATSPQQMVLQSTASGGKNCLWLTIRCRVHLIHYHFLSLVLSSTPGLKTYFFQVFFL